MNSEGKMDSLADRAARVARTASLSNDCEKRWVILRTGGPRTLPLFHSLAAAGFDVWTPIAVQKRRLPRRKVQVVRDVAITPTFVFARADHLADLIRIRELPTNPHPAFSVFRYYGRVPVLADREIEALRTEERRVVPKDKARVFAQGQQVKVPEGSFAGMSGVVEQGDGRFTLVSFGGRMRVKIATFLLRTDEVQAGRPPKGTAA